MVECLVLREIFDAMRMGLCHDRSLIYVCSEYSMQLNASRIKVLQAQDDLVNSMREAASKELLRVSSDDHHYEKLLKDLIVQVCSRF